jgi:hypothetical protein
MSSILKKSNFQAHFIVLMTCVDLAYMKSVELKLP